VYLRWVDDNGEVSSPHPLLGLNNVDQPHYLPSRGAHVGQRSCALAVDFVGGVLLEPRSDADIAHVMHHPIEQSSEIVIGKGCLRHAGDPDEELSALRKV
jgi:hypothetical protein